MRNIRRSVAFKGMFKRIYFLLKRFTEWWNYRFVKQIDLCLKPVYSALSFIRFVTRMTATFFFFFFAFKRQEQQNVRCKILKIQLLHKLRPINKAIRQCEKQVLSERWRNKWSKFFRILFLHDPPLPAVDLCRQNSCCWGSAESFVQCINCWYVYREPVTLQLGAICSI